MREPRIFTDAAAVERLDEFLASLQVATLPEAPCELHTRLTHTMWNWCKNLITLPENSEVLDIGCGQGVALEMFHDEGLNACGITCNAVDYEAAVQRLRRFEGQHVYFRDMHNMMASSGAFSFCWARHSLEHSPMPLWVLVEIHRILRTGCHLYVEVPSPDTIAGHVSNQSHFSVFPKVLWEEMFRRANFEIVEGVDINFGLEIGPETYFAWLLKAAA